MAKQMSNSQELDNKGKAKLLSLFAGWVPNELHNDRSAVDYFITLTRENATAKDVEPLDILVQLKSIGRDRRNVRKDGYFSIQLSKDDIDILEKRFNPAILIVFDEKTNELYWESINRHTKKSDKYTVHVSYKNILTDLTAFEKEIKQMQFEVTRQRTLSIPIGAGISPDEKNLKEFAERSLKEFKLFTLKSAYNEMKQGRMGEAKKVALNVLKSPETDTYKLQAISFICAISDRVSQEERIKLIELASYGEEEARKIGDEGLQRFIQIQKNEAQILFLIKKRSDMKQTLDMASSSGGDELTLAILRNELQKITNLYLLAVSEINVAVGYLVQKNKYYFFSALPTIISINGVQLGYASVEDEKVLTDKKFESGSIRVAQEIVDKIPDPDLKMNVYRALAHYFYVKREPEVAKKYLKALKKSAEENKDRFMLDIANEQLEQIKQKPVPFQNKSINQEDISLDEYAKMIKQFLINTENYDETKNDTYTEALKWGLNDLVIEDYFRHCENLHIVFASTSHLGKITGVPTIGQKFLWCQYKGGLLGKQIKQLFDQFKSEKCLGCPHHKPRDKDWVGTVGFFEKQRVNPELLKTFKEQMNDYQRAVDSLRTK